LRERPPQLSIQLTKNELKKMSVHYLLTNLETKNTKSIQASVVDETFYFKQYPISKGIHLVP